MKKAIFVLAMMFGASNAFACDLVKTTSTMPNKAPDYAVKKADLLLNNNKAKPQLPRQSVPAGTTAVG